jgi:hypothetical protein
MHVDGHLVAQSAGWACRQRSQTMSGGVAAADRDTTARACGDRRGVADLLDENLA